MAKRGVAWPKTTRLIRTFLIVLACIPGCPAQARSPSREFSKMFFTISAQQVFNSSFETIMIKRHHLASLLIAAVTGTACMSSMANASSKGQPVAIASTAATGPYQTQLFNLLSKDANIVDGKHYYQSGFAKQFDALLASSSLAKADKTGLPLKKRLLSGPAPEPALRADPTTGTQWIVYDACQAHRCDEISLRLLYDPVSRRMVGKLNLDKQSEFLGVPSVGEQRLLGQDR